MKKFLVGISSVIALIGSFFAVVSPVQAGGGPHIVLSSSSGSWDIIQGQNMVVSAKVYPETAKIAHIYFYSDNTLIKTCYAINNCSATIVNPSVGKHSLFVFAVDSTGNYYYLNGSYVQSFNVITQASIIPTANLKSVGTAYVTNTSTAGIFIQAQAKGEQLKTLTITRSDDSSKTISTSCAKTQSLCTLNIYPTFASNEIGKTYLYEAVVTDAAGHKVASNKIKATVVAAPKPASTVSNTPSPVQSGLNPVLAATPSTLGVNQTFNLNGTATNANGVWGVEVRALPSWSNVALRNRCILSNKPTTGSCSMNIGSFAGHVGQSVKVWVIYWDARTGLGYSSEMRTITLN